MNRASETCKMASRKSTHIMGVPGRKERNKAAEKIFEEIITENFSNLVF